MSEKNKVGAVELLPCPFCGGTDQFVERLDYTACFVQCDSSVGEHEACCMRGPIGLQDGDEEEMPGRNAAIAAWNRRAAASAQATEPVFSEDRCAQDVFEHGTSIGFFDIPKEVANAICAGFEGCSAITGVRVDWHYFAGRVHMKALAAPAAPHAAESVRRDAEPRTLDEYHEDYGNVVWWCWQDGEWLGEPAWIGKPDDSDWPDYHTHWTPHPGFPAALSQPKQEG